MTTSPRPTLPPTLAEALAGLHRDLQHLAPPETADGVPLAYAPIGALHDAADLLRRVQDDGSYRVSIALLADVLDLAAEGGIQHGTDLAAAVIERKSRPRVVRVKLDDLLGVVWLGGRQ